MQPVITLCDSCGAVYCNRSCLWVGVCVCVWVCYHDNSKLRASIFTKLGLKVKVVTIPSWLNFGRPAPPGRGSAAGRKFRIRLTTTSAQCLRLSERFFFILTSLTFRSSLSETETSTKWEYYWLRFGEFTIWNVHQRNGSVYRQIPLCYAAHIHEDYR